MIRATQADTQAIYLYGTWGTEYQRPDSDLGIAVLLPPARARTIDSVAWFRLTTEVTQIAEEESADLINLRTVPVMLRKEVIADNRRIYCANENAADELDMLTLS